MFAFWQNKKKPGGGAGLLKAVLAHRERENLQSQNMQRIANSKSSAHS